MCQGSPAQEGLVGAEVAVLRISTSGLRASSSRIISRAHSRLAA